MLPMVHVALAAGSLAGGVAVWSVVRLRVRERRSIGDPIHTVPGRRLARLGLAAIAVAFLTLAARWELSLAVLGAGLITLTLALAVLSPGAGDRVCGSRGVRAGWEVLRFDEFAEWRLTGDHLRFRGRSEWTAVDLPRALHPAVRALLESQCPGAESRFRA